MKTPKFNKSIQQSRDHSFIEDPTGAMLRRFGEEPLLRMLELVGEAGRIDVLLGIRQFLR